MDAAVPAETMAPVPQTQRRQLARWRLVAVFHEGWTKKMAVLILHDALLVGRLRPRRWPQMAPPNVATKADQPPGPKKPQLCGLPLPHQIAAAHGLQGPAAANCWTLLACSRLRARIDKWLTNPLLGTCSGIP